MLKNRYLRLVLALLASGLLSFGVGLSAGWLTSLLNCEGEQLACNIDDAVGAYATIIMAVLGALDLWRDTLGRDQ